MMQDYILRDETYASVMAETVEPYLAQRRKEFRIPRGAGNELYCVHYDAGDARGVVVISHGFTETAEKYLENIYYFVNQGYHVYHPEHCGHGRSYRLVDDPSLVHVDRYARYVEDLLAVADVAKREHPQLPLFLYAHSMGGGIGAAALAAQPELFQRAILSSPMIRPLTAGVPWPLAKLTAAMLCIAGKDKAYVPGSHAFDGNERFEDSASINRERYEYYQRKRNAEPLYQMNAASCGWLNEAAKLNRHLMHKGFKRIQTPTLLFQAQDDAFVSAQEQERFVEKVNRAGRTQMKAVSVPGTRHAGPRLGGTEADYP